MFYKFSTFDHLGELGIRIPFPILALGRWEMSQLKRGGGGRRGWDWVRNPVLPEWNYRKRVKKLTWGNFVCTQ